jgi:hypothetical protein
MSIPKSFAADLDRVEYIQTGDYLISRPYQYEDNPGPVKASFPEYLRKIKNPGDNADKFNFVARNIAQSYIISGTNVIEVEIPEDIDQETRDQYEEAWFKVQHHSRDHLYWDPGKFRMEIEGGITLEQYTREIKQFIQRYLISILSRDNGFTDLIEFESESKEAIDGHQSLEMFSQEVYDIESEIDTRWSLAIRHLGKSFYSMQRSEYPKAICGFYITKYLEMCVDLIMDLINSFAYLENKFEEDMPEIVESFRSEIKSLYIPGNTDSFDEALSKIAIQSYNLRTSKKEFLRRSEKYENNSIHVSAIQNSIIPSMFENISRRDLPVPPQEFSKFNLCMGRITTLSERIVRLPRSICHLGLGAKNVAEARGMLN